MQADPACLKVNLNVPPLEGDLARSQGARWNPALKRWYVNATCLEDLERVIFWLPDDILHLTIAKKFPGPVDPDRYAYQLLSLMSRL